ncbi:MULTISPECIES: STAS domain-containing protein [Actinomadura]|uniref:STAS domain-containing protein n=1 Tax=Actinomadura yumaensis TaxID=111807 RepID=A0ABW2CIJ0_9ACTN|nr:STAS domain-containing protein [Actinomadura sp. J1-007]
MRDRPTEEVEFRSEAGSEDQAVLVFPDQVDIANASEVRAHALRLLDQGVHSLELDLTQCRFCDSSGVNVILRSHIRAKALGVHLAVRLPPTGVVARVCQVAGVTRVVPQAPAR